MAHATIHRPPFPSPRLVALLAGLALLPAGCGLSDYEAQMSNEGALVRQWEEEAKLLGDPLRMPEFPKKEGDKGPPPSWVVFLRPPLGVNEVPMAQQGSKLTQMKGPLAQYNAKANPFGMQAVYLGVGGDPKEFPASVYSQFGAAAGDESAVPIPRSAVLLGSGTGRELKPEITVKRKLFDSQSHYSFNFYERGKTLVAVVYQMTKESAKKAEPEKAIRASLGTLGEGREEVPALRDAFLSRNRKTK